MNYHKVGSPSPTQPRKDHGNNRKVSQRGLLSLAMMLICMGGFGSAALGGAKIVFDVLGDRLFDVNSDSVDMENGSMQWKGKTFNLGNSRAMRMRFERYLASPAAGGDMTKYIATLTQIEKILAQ